MLFRAELPNFWYSCSIDVTLLGLIHGGVQTHLQNLCSIKRRIKNVIFFYAANNYTLLFWKKFWGFWQQTVVRYKAT